MQRESAFSFSFAATRWRQGLLHARPRHAEDQPASDRGETTPPPAPARARSVNTYARPSSHGNIRASRAAATHAAPTACSRPGPPTTRSGGLRGRRTPPGRRTTTRSAPQPTAQPCQPGLRLKASQTGRTAEYSTQHTPAARAQHTQTHARPQGSGPALLEEDLLASCAKGGLVGRSADL